MRQYTQCVLWVGVRQGHPFWVEWYVLWPHHATCFRGENKNILNILFFAIVLIWFFEEQKLHAELYVPSCVFMWTQKWEKCTHSSRNSEQYFYQTSQYSIAGVITRLQARQPRNLVWFSCHSIQTSSGAHPASSLMDTVVCFPSGKVAEMRW